ncbi:RND transporter, partial [Acinetobacter baumannii]
MKKIVLAMAAASVVGFSASAQAASTVCVFDLLGKAGDSYKMMEEWA